MLTAYPLQTKRLRSLLLPWLEIGLCDVMNAKPTFDGAAYLFTNNHNAKPFESSTNDGGGGFTAGAGVFDSYGGPMCSRFVASGLHNIMSLHDSDATRQRELMRTLPRGDPMAVALETTRALQRSRSMAESQSCGTHFVDPELMSQYTHAVDSAFLSYCHNRFGSKMESLGIDQIGCRGAWFSSTLRWEQAENNLINTFVNVSAANVGNCRTFVIAKNPATKAMHSALKPTRWRVSQLSMDHTTYREEDFGRIRLAGGVVDSAKHGLIDGHSHMNVSRAFGYWFMKNNPKLPPSRQKLIAQPSITPSIQIHAGDVVVCMNFGAFETRSGDLSTVDEVADVIMSTLEAGGSATDAAGSICDHAICFGANHSLQAVVAVVPETLAPGPGLANATFSESVVPGPLYPTVCLASHERLAGFHADVERCGITVEKWLALRYDMLAPLFQRSRCDVLAHFHRSFGRECAMMNQVIDDEQEFFGAAPGAGKSRDHYFEQLAQKLLLRAKV